MTQLIERLEGEKKIKAIWRYQLGNNINSPPLIVKMKNSIATLENSLAVSYKLKLALNDVGVSNILDICQR